MCFQFSFLKNFYFSFSYWKLLVNRSIPFSAFSLVSKKKKCNKTKLHANSIKTILPPWFLLSNLLLQWIKTFNLHLLQKISNRKSIKQTRSNTVKSHQRCGRTKTRAIVWGCFWNHWCSSFYGSIGVKWDEEVCACKQWCKLVCSRCFINIWRQLLMRNEI